jgi:hypothetical protein
MHGGAHELVAMIEREGRVRMARVQGHDVRALGAAVWAKLEAGARA